MVMSVVGYSKSLMGLKSQQLGFHAKQSHKNRSTLDANSTDSR